MKMNIHDIDEAEEEILSLLDYSINTAAAESERGEEEEEDYSTSMIEHEEHYFEFCREDQWSTTTVANAPESIIFCGKIIPYQQPTSGTTQNSQSIKEKSQKKPGIFQSKYKRNGSANNKKGDQPKSPAMEHESRKFSVHKISVLASPGKFRWYLLFGITRFPTEMALRDMKNRQNRGIPPSPLFRSECSGDKKKVSSSTTDTECKSRGRRLWGLLQALVSGGHCHANTVVMAP